MSTTDDATVEHPRPHRWGRCGTATGRRGNWSGANVLALVLGFALFWPFGLLMVFWSLRGRDVRELPGAVRRRWRRAFGDRSAARTRHGGNAAFDAFQKTQRERVRELKAQIRERADRFDEFRAQARRRADEEEFERFMADAPERPEG